METTKAMCMHNNSRDLRKKQKQIKNKGVFSKWGKGHLQVCSFFFSCFSSIQFGVQVKKIQAGVNNPSLRNSLISQGTDGSVT